MLTDEQLKNHMRDAFREELDFGAICAFDELTKDEQDHIIGIGDDQAWGSADLEEASWRGSEYNDNLTDDQKDAAIHRHYESGGPRGVYAKFLPADIVEYYHLHDIVKARGWVRNKGEHIDAYYPPETIERWKIEEEQEQSDARDLELGRTFGRKLDALMTQGDRIERKVGDIDGKVNETQNAANLALKADREIAKGIKTIGPRISSAVERGMEKTTRAVSGARVQIDHLKDAIEKKDDDLEGVRQLQRDTLAAVHELKDGKPAETETTAPDPRDYQVTTRQLANLLKELNAGRTMRQIQNWEKHLKSNGSKGTPPPDGYNLGTRLTIETATAWAQTFASHETNKLKTKVAFDDRFHQRPK